MAVRRASLPGPSTRTQARCPAVAHTPRRRRRPRLAAFRHPRSSAVRYTPGRSPCTKKKQGPPIGKKSRPPMTEFSSRESRERGACPARRADPLQRSHAFAEDDRAIRTPAATPRLDNRSQDRRRSAPSRRFASKSRVQNRPASDRPETRMETERRPCRVVPETRSSRAGEPTASKRPPPSPRRQPSFRLGRWHFRRLAIESTNSPPAGGPISRLSARGTATGAANRGAEPTEHSTACEQRDNGHHPSRG